MSTTGSDEDRKPPPEVMKGASSLMGMFEPPVETDSDQTSSSLENKSRPAIQKQQNIENGATALVSPKKTSPAEEETDQTTPISSSRGSSSLLGSLGAPKSDTESSSVSPQTPTCAPPSGASNLLSMFQEAPDNSSSKTLEKKGGHGRQQQIPYSSQGDNSSTAAASNLLSMFQDPSGLSNEKTPLKGRKIVQVEEPRLGASDLMSMFQKPPTPLEEGYPPSPPKITPNDRMPTERHGNVIATERTKLFRYISDQEATDDAKWSYRATDDLEETLLPPPPPSKWKEFAKRHLQTSTFAGAFMFLLYHVVFCLANGSAIVRPSSDQPILGVMAKWTTVGILGAGPFYIYRLGQDIPAVYPSVDLFLAPFLASAAAVVDRTLSEDGIEDNHVFLASFAVLAAIGMFLSGSLLLLAATFKLANLGSFLPYSVLCGFFSAVGVLLWALAFSVDNNGKTWQYVFFSGDWQTIGNALLHHIPSLTVGILMNLLGPKHPFYVILLIIVTIVAFYVTMMATGTSLEEAQEAEWFWGRHDLIIQPTTAMDEGNMFASWMPPLPLGHFGALFQGLVNWKAVSAGLSDMFALSFLYLLRSSIHSSAMKKNVNNLVCKTRVKKSPKYETRQSRSTGHSYAKAAMDTFSENIKAVNETLEGTYNASGLDTSIRPRAQSSLKMQSSDIQIELPTDSPQVENKKHESDNYEYVETRAKPCRLSLQEIFIEYGYGLLLVALSGGFGLCPTVATSNTMYAIGAGGDAPQYGSVLLLISFYLTDFVLVRYIPKACFSSLLVLGAVDTFVVWFVLSFRKTQDLLEWLVVPFIVLFSLIVGFLNAVFLGVGISTFVFVASFFRVGVVKFNATGLEIRSTIERSIPVSDWLDANGDLIQVICLQNYLMFMNASSIFSYIETMFEDIDEDASQDYIPPTPRVLIIDMSLNTGMDTSTVDIFAEIKELCKNNDCKLFLCGLSARTKKGLSLAGVKPEPGLRDKRSVRFFSTLDTALGKAEDLVTFELYEKDKTPTVWKMSKSTDATTSGFRTALKEIDKQHGQEFSLGLFDLEPYTVPIELRAGDYLFACDGGSVQNCERGLFFIESGMLKIERDAGQTLTRGRNTQSRTRGFTLNNRHARGGTVGNRLAALKANTRTSTMQTFRLARFGPGWVCGAIEGASGLRHPGIHVALSDCRLHHLPFQTLEQIEEENPKLLLQLYKMLSHLMARRQEITIEQLATFHSIMSSPAHSKPLRHFRS